MDNSDRRDPYDQGKNPNPSESAADSYQHGFYPFSSDYTDRLTRQPDGSYKWRSDIDADYYHSQLNPGFWACLGIALFILLYGVFLSFHFGDWETLMVVAGSDAVFLLIAFAAFYFLGWRVKDPQEIYEMTRDYVKTGTGKSSSYFYYHKVKKIIVRSRYIELRGKHKKMRIYAPEEMLSFVRTYIQSRIPGEAELVFDM